MNRQLKDSLKTAFAIIGGIATVFTILGISVSTVFSLSEMHWLERTLIYFFIAVLGYIFLVFAVWIWIEIKYKNSIILRIGRNTVTIEQGDIFKTPGWRVIPVDATFSTAADDTVISKNSLHGKLVLEYGNSDQIEAVVKCEAEKRKLQENNGTCKFPLGTVIPYACEEKNGEKSTYLMVALTDLDENWEAHTTMAQYEHTLMEMWKELSRVYAQNDIVLPLIGSGITRFDDGQDDPASLLRCMLCTLNTSRIHLNAKITVVIYHNGRGKVPLYEYKELFKIAK